MSLRDKKRSRTSIFESIVGEHQHDGFARIDAGDLDRRRAPDFEMSDQKIVRTSVAARQSRGPAARSAPHSITEVEDTVVAEVERHEQVQQEAEEAHVDALCKPPSKESTDDEVATRNSTRYDKKLSAKVESVPECLRRVHGQSIQQSWIEAASEFVSFGIHEQAVLRNYFILHDDDGSRELSCSEFMDIVADMGRMPEPSSEDAVALEQLRVKLDTDHSGELSFSEFVGLMQAYYLSVYQRVFSKHYKGIGCNKQVVVAMLEEVNDLGFTVAYQSQQKLVKLATEIMEKCSYNFGFVEWCKLMSEYRTAEFNYLQKTGGMSPEQTNPLRTLFDQFDVDKSGTLDIREIADLVREHTQEPIADVSTFIELFARMDVDYSGTLDFEEFLRLLKVYERQYDRQRPAGSVKLKKKACRTDKVYQEALSTGLYRRSTHSYTRNTADMLQNATLANDLEDGFLAQHYEIPLDEISVLRESFEFCDWDSSGSIDTEEFQELLQTIGYSPKTQMQKTVLLECLSSEGDKALSFHDMIDLLHRYHKALAHEVFCASSGNGQVVQRGQLSVMLYQAGEKPAGGDVARLLEEMGVTTKDTPLASEIDEVSLEKLLASHRAEKLEKWRECFGFSSSQVTRFQQIFDSLDDGSCPDGVSRSCIKTLLTKLGYMPDDPKAFSALLGGMARIDIRDTGIRFHDLLLVLRRLENRKLAQARESEEKSLQASGLEQDELRLLRDSFNSCGTSQYGMVTVTQHEVKVLLINKYRIAQTQDQRRALTALLKKEAGDNALTFNLFLRVLRELGAVLDS